MVASSGMVVLKSRLRYVVAKFFRLVLNCTGVVVDAPGLTSSGGVVMSCFNELQTLLVVYDAKPETGAGAIAITGHAGRDGRERHPSDSRYDSPRSGVDALGRFRNEALSGRDRMEHPTPAAESDGGAGDV